MDSRTRIQRIAFNLFIIARLTIFDCFAIAIAAVLFMGGHWLKAILWCVLAVIASKLGGYVAWKRIDSGLFRQ
jgi:hypothetical protein